MNMPPAKIKKALFGIVISIILIAPLSAANQVTVLCYHSFLGTKKFSIDFSIEQLRTQMEILKESGYRFVSYDELFLYPLKGNKNVLITLDDGHFTHWKAYQEVFKPMGIKPLIAVYPSIISRSRYALSWDQLKTMHSEGCTIAAHGYTHYRLDDYFYRRHPKQFFKEIYRPKLKMARELGFPITVFVYPFGARGELTRQTVKKAGYEYAFQLGAQNVILPLQNNSDRYDLPRFMMTQYNWKSIFKGMM